MTVAQPDPGDLPPRPQFVGPDGRPIKRAGDDNARARHNANGRFIPTPKRNRSRQNKAKHAEMRAQEAEAKYQADRERKISELIAQGYGPQRISEIMSEGTSIADALAKRRRRTRKTED